MMNKSCCMKRILALILALITLLPCAPALAESYTAIIAETSLPVYADAAMTKWIADVDGYSLVTVKAVKGDVAQLRYQGYTIYADAGALVAVDDIAIPAVVTDDSYVFETPDMLSRSVPLKAGVKLNVLKTNGDWAMVEKNGHLGYTYLGYLAPETADEPQPDSTVDPFLPESEQPSAGATGGDTITIETFPARVSSATLPVYKSASASSRKLGTLKLAQEVTVYAYNAEWAYIGLNGNFGFAKRSGLEKAASETPDEVLPDLSGAIPGTVTAASVKVYAEANTASKTLGTLQKGAEVNVLKTNANEGWAYIELNGNYGYCALDALTRTSDLLPEDTKEEEDVVIGDKSPLGTATVIEAAAPVYDSMSTSAVTNATLKMGETVSYYGYDSKWVLVGKDGKFGFVPRKYLNADSYAQLQNEDSGAAVLDLETALLALGYLDGVPSNNYTNVTADAVKRLQAACGMSETGIADVGTLRVLYSGNAPVSPMLSISLSSGDKNGNVTRLQTRLLSLGYLSSASSIDGSYGNTTASAIRLFQKAAGISATGTADNNTIRALYHAQAPALPSGTNAADAVTQSSGSSGNSTSMNSGLASTTDKYVAGMSNAQKLEYVIYVAQQQLGKKYVFGSAGTSTFDCSGLTMYCFKQVGVSLKHSAYSEGYNDNRQKISSKSSLRRGDLVFFNTMSDGDQCDHVGIYLGNDYFIHASSGAGKVVVSGLGSGYYSRVFSWGRRVLDT